jgi:hypothetical protein
MVQKPARAPAAMGMIPVKLVKPKEAELLFIAYFDWDHMDCIDLRYYRVKISTFDAHS